MGLHLPSEARTATDQERSRRNAFAALGIERGGDALERPGWLQAQRQDPRARQILIDAKGHAALDGNGGLLRLPLPATTLGEDEVFLGIEAGAPIFAASAQEALRSIDLREAAARLSAAEASLFAYARALLLWHRSSRHCGACGTATAMGPGGRTRVCGNGACARVHFPRTDPAIIVLVEHEGRCLLGRQPAWAPKRFSTLAGFVEPGETLEDAVRREVAEEAGVIVGACHYRSSQPWPFPGALMIGFRAHAEDAALRLGEELAEAAWFSAEELVAAVASRRIGISPPMSVAYQLIREWVEDQGLSL
ncbi:MAG TPA: NAD(+) diphosphatase [Xanthomonadaceae bacterium]|nr:NAD(+) diphosphatase [Xanthomonadaceae bacterium]